MIFDQKILSQFDTDEHLTVFALLKIKFLKGNEDQMDIVLDVKQTEIPFFMMVIRNEYLNFLNFIVQKI